MSTLQLHVFCCLATHSVQFLLSYTGMSEEFVPFFNINEYHYGSDPLTSPMGTLQRRSVSLMKGNVNSEAHCPPYAQWSSAFHSPITKWLVYSGDFKSVAKKTEMQSGPFMPLMYKANQPELIRDY